MSALYQLRWFIYLDCSVDAFLTTDYFPQQMVFMVRIKNKTMAASLLMLNEAIWHPIARFVNFFLYG